MLFGFMLLGIWMVASLRGGITSLDNSENMSNFFQNLWTTINPFERLTRGFENFYFGFAALVIIIFGILFGYKKIIIACDSYKGCLSSREVNEAIAGSSRRM